MRNALLKQWRQRTMDRGFCWERDRLCKKASWRCRGRCSAGAGRYEESWQCGIDERRAWKDIAGDDGSYQRQSEWSCKFRLWGGLGRWGWWRDRAGWAQRRWQTRLGNVHNHHNGAAVPGEVLSESDEAWRIDTTGMEGLSQFLMWKR